MRPFIIVLLALMAMTLRAQETSATGTVVVLGPTAEWMTPRVGEPDPALTSTYLASLEAIINGIEGPVDVVAMGPFSNHMYPHQSDESIRTLFASAEVRVLIPSPSEMMYGAAAVNREGQRFGGLPVLCEISPPLRPNETDYSASQIRLIASRAAMRSLNANSGVSQMLLGVDPAESMITSDAEGVWTDINWGELQRPTSEVENGDSGIQLVGRDSILPQTHEAMLLSVADLGETRELRTLLPPTHPLLNQPALADVQIGAEAHVQFIERDLQRPFNLDSHSQMVVRRDRLPGTNWPMSNDTINLYRLYRDGNLTQTAMLIECNTGVAGGTFSYWLIRIEAGNNVVHKFMRTPIIGGRPTLFANAVDAVRGRLATDRVWPMNPPEMRGVDLLYRAFVESFTLGERLLALEKSGQIL